MWYTVKKCFRFEGGIAVLLLGYLLGFATVAVLVRKRGDNVRSLVLVGYNYIFATAMLTAAQLAGEPITWQSIAAALIRGMYDSPTAMTFQGSMSNAVNLQEMVIFCAMSIYTLRAAVVLFFRKAWNYLRMCWRLWSAKKIYVVWGEKEAAAVLLRDIHNHVKRAAAVWIPFSGKATTELPAFPATAEFLQRPKPGRICHIILLPDEKQGNLERVKELDALGEKAADYHVTAFLDDDLLRLQDLHFSRLDACPVSRQELLMRQFIRDHRPLQLLCDRSRTSEKNGILVPERPFSLCLAGLSRLNRALLLSTWENTAFETESSDGRGLDAVVLGAAPSARELFFRDYPAFRDSASLTWRAGDAASALYAMAEDAACVFDEIVIDVGNTSQNVEAALRVLRLLRRRGVVGDRLPLIAVVLHEKAEGSTSLLAEEPQVCFLQENSSILTYADLVERDFDREAEKLHQRYRGTSMISAGWRNLGTFTQSSNRAVVWDIPNKLLLGRDAAELPADKRNKALWRLAEYEHRRWVAFHAAHGWSLLPASELTEQEREDCATKRPAERRHACMVDWDDLDTLPQREPGLLKKYDYMNVEELFGAKEADHV